jgi:hypothetical protein
VESLTEFLSQRWYVVLAAVAIVFVALKLAKAVVKWGLVLVALVGVVVYGVRFESRPPSLEKMLGAPLSGAQDQLAKVVEKEMADARYEAHRDGSFTVRTRSVEIRGKTGARDVKLTFMDRTVDVRLDDTLAKLIDQARKNSGS